MGDNKNSAAPTHGRKAARKSVAGAGGVLEAPRSALGLLLARAMGVDAVKQSDTGLVFDPRSRFFLGED